jgi:hypothetical protein
MMPMTVPLDGYVERLASVSSTCLAALARNRYPVPCELAGQMTSTRLYPNEVAVVAGDAIVARHARLDSKARTRYDWGRARSVRNAARRHGRGVRPCHTRFEAVDVNSFPACAIGAYASELCNERLAFLHREPSKVDFHHLGYDVMNPGGDDATHVCQMQAHHASIIDRALPGQESP